MSTESDHRIDLTEGDVFRPLMLLSVPIVLSQLLQVAYNLIDTYWVGQLGAAAVSTISFSWPIIFLMISLASGFTVAGTTLVSQNEGAGDHAAVNHVAGQTIAFTLGGSLLVATFGYLLAPTLITLVGATPGSAVFAGAVTYTRTMFLGIYLMFGFFMFQALLRGYGDTVTPMYLMAFGVAFNTVLDPLLIYGFTNNALFGLVGLGGLEAALFGLTGFTGFGVQGAAIASLVARGTGAIIGLALLFSGRVGIEITPTDLTPDLDTFRQIALIGAPSSAEQSMRALGVTALAALIAIAGPDAVAAFGIGNRLNSLVFLPAIGLAQGTATAVGQNLGAAKIERAKRSVVLSSEVIAAALVVLSVFAFLFARPVVAIFVSGPQAETVIEIGASYLRIIGPTFLFLGVFRVINGAFKGSGNTGTSMGLSILSLWVFRLPLAYALLVWLDMGAIGVWYAIAVSNVASAVVAGAWFLRGTWTESVIEEHAEHSGSAQCEGDCVSDHHMN